MCGFGAVAQIHGEPIPFLERALQGVNELLEHRGPDDEGAWVHPRRGVGLAHRRLSIIGLTDGHQPMTDPAGNWISYNGEIFNYLELRKELGEGGFRTASDTEVVLAAYRRWGVASLQRLRGMFAYALWDEASQSLLLARDRFGIKPLYYTVVDDILFAASEIKALLPFLPEIRTDEEGLRDYLTFQFTMAGKTLFKGVHELLPGHWMQLRNGSLTTHRYWEVTYEPDLDHTESFHVSRLRELTYESVAQHCRADVPIGAYLSGGLDSSIVATLAARGSVEPLQVFTGAFAEGPQYDETAYAREVAAAEGMQLHEIPVTADDFVNDMASLAYHLDQPVAGPGAFPQFVVSRFAARHRKVVLGGQGGDEIFGGYVRYLLAYFEQCIKAAIDGTADRAPYIVTYESIIPNLGTLREYKPLIREFWQHGLFDDLDNRYFRLVDRGSSLTGIVDSSTFNDYSPLETFMALFRADNVGQDSYFDRMTHFDFKTLLPALLHVEDRVSMAHGLESRVPFVDHEIVEFAATLPAAVKFKNGELKHALRAALADLLPDSVATRRDKMGFPVPLDEWSRGPVRSFLLDSLSGAAERRSYLDPRFDPSSLIDGEQRFGRGLWAILSLELWQQQFHDRQAHWTELGRAYQSSTALGRPS